MCTSDRNGLQLFVGHRVKARGRVWDVVLDEYMFATYTIEKWEGG